jgi:Fe2+ or Zn2+ uptake regulation protein
MKNYVPILKEKKIKITPQRIGVLDILTRENKHLTVEQIYGKMKDKFPAVSLATIYSILELYSKQDIISQVRITSERSCYEARTESHHHFYCTICKKIYDIDLQPCPALKASMVEGHSIEKLHGYFYGRCKNCLGK